MVFARKIAASCFEITSLSLSLIPQNSASMPQESKQISRMAPPSYLATLVSACWQTNISGTNANASLNKPLMVDAHGDKIGNPMLSDRPRQAQEKQ
jgi:hypothetical protein